MALDLLAPPSSDMSNPGSTDEILFDRVGPHIVLVIINRPRKYNAIDVATSRALARIVKTIEADPSIRVAILASMGGKAFSSGADLEEVAAGHGMDLVIGNDGLGGLVHACRRKPWIAAVRGLALGGGLELALACDLIVAGDSARFALPEAKHGLIAGAGGVYRLPRSIPPAIAREMLMTGDGIDSARAQTLGMINARVPDGEVISRAIELAESIAANAPLAVQEGLSIARNSLDYAEDELRSMMDAACCRLAASEDMQEGVKAFMEKRKPQWQGR